MCDTLTHPASATRLHPIPSSSTRNRHPSPPPGHPIPTSTASGWERRVERAEFDAGVPGRFAGHLREFAVTAGEVAVGAGADLLLQLADELEQPVAVGQLDAEGRRRSSPASRRRGRRGPAGPSGTPAPSARGRPGPPRIRVRPPAAWRRRSFPRSRQPPRRHRPRPRRAVRSRARPGQSTAYFSGSRRAAGDPSRLPPRLTTDSSSPRNNLAEALRRRRPASARPAAVVPAADATDPCPAFGGRGSMRVRRVWASLAGTDVRGGPHGREPCGRRHPTSG